MPLRIGLGRTWLSCPGAVTTSITELSRLPNYPPTGTTSLGMIIVIRCLTPSFIGRIHTVWSVSVWPCHSPPMQVSLCSPYFEIENKPQLKMAGMTELYKGWKTWTVTLAGQFHWPLRRELLMIGGMSKWVSNRLTIAGAGISSKRNLTWILRQEEKVEFQFNSSVKWFDISFVGTSGHSCSWRS